MFEDLSRLIDHQIYLATQAYLQGLLGNRSTSHANSESAVVPVAAAASTNGGRRTLSSTPISPVTLTENTDSSRAPAAARQDQHRTQLRDEKGERSASETQGLEETRAPPLATSLLSSPQGVEGRGGLVASFETLRLGSYYDKAKGNIIGRSPEKKGEKPSRTRIARDENRHDLNRPVLSSRHRAILGTPTKYKGLDASTPLKPLPQPIIASRVADSTQSHVARSPRVVQIPRPSPRRSDASCGASRGSTAAAALNTSGHSNKNDTERNAIPDTNLRRLPSDSSSSEPHNLANIAKVPAPRLIHEQFTRTAVEQSRQGQQQQQQLSKSDNTNEEEEDLSDSSPLSNITTITLLVEALPLLKHFYERVFAVTSTHEDDVSVTFPFNKGRLSVTLIDHRQRARPPLARHRDVGMSVTVENIDYVWNRLRMLREGKGKGREEDGPTDDGLRFGGLAATGWEEPEKAEGRKRILFCDPAGYCWEVTEESYYT